MTTTATVPSRIPAHPAPARRKSALLRHFNGDFRHLTLDQIYDLAEALHGRAVPGITMTEAEFAAWCDKDVRAEWVDGRIFLMAPANLEHDDLHTWLTTLVRSFVEEHDAGQVFHDVFVRLTGQHRRRVPDLLFVAADRAHIQKPTFLDGAPDLLIEIVSPDSQSRDRRDKYLEYEKAGVREYWIIDPLSKTAEVYELHRKKYRLISDSDGVVASVALKDFKLKTGNLWQKPLPKVAGVLKQMTRL